MSKINVRKVVCKKCGVCCNTKRGIVLTGAESNRITRGKIISSGISRLISREGVCSLLEKKLCAEYKNRPSLCKHYPFVFINGRAILQMHCSAMAELSSQGIIEINRTEIDKIPFLKKALVEIEKVNPFVKEQSLFFISDR